MNWSTIKDKRGVPTASRSVTLAIVHLLTAEQMDRYHTATRVRVSADLARVRFEGGNGSAYECALNPRAERPAAQMAQFAVLLALGHGPDKAAALVRSGDAPRVIREAQDPRKGS